MIYTDKGKATIFKGDREPIARFEGDKQVAGYVLNEKVGNGSVIWESPYKAVIPKVEIDGEGKQEKLEGKNLIPFPYYATPNFTANGITYSTDKNGAVTIEGNATGFSQYVFQRRIAINENTKYVFSIQSNENIQNIAMTALLYENDNYLTSITTEKSTICFDTAQHPTANFVNLQIKPSSQSNTPTYFKGTPQLEFGNTPTPYEPYCGGIPAPNPTYPIEPTWGGDRKLEVSTPHQEIQVPVLRAIPNTNYKDTYNPQNGEITRRVKENIYDGSEDWAVNAHDSRGNSYLQLYTNDVIDIPPTEDNRSKAIISNIASALENTGIGYMRILSGQRFYICLNNMEANEFKAYLKELYDKGTPLKVWYPLEKPVVEKVSTTPLIQDGNGQLLYDGQIKATVYEEYKD